MRGRSQSLIKHASCHATRKSFFSLIYDGGGHDGLVTKSGGILRFRLMEGERVKTNQDFKKHFLIERFDKDFVWEIQGKDASIYDLEFDELGMAYVGAVQSPVKKRDTLPGVDPGFEKPQNIGNLSRRPRDRQRLLYQGPSHCPGRL
ncbi:unnamed protein product [Clavelina lepadiformis]|uniref:Uncharacterized protein n=1 Tax=Clavelina lepadiformis TaxID=159417 RepID=A0ABP0GN37_CLALP